jgi:predicted nucleic acid-binding protein
MAGSAGAPVWRVVLDANILLQAPIRDTLLRLAEARILVVFWSPDILAEVSRTFAAVSGSTDAPRRLAHLLAALQTHFPEASVSGYEALLPTLRIAPHDRHVAGCALVAGARIIVTYSHLQFARFSAAVACRRGHSSLAPRCAPLCNAGASPCRNPAGYD